MADKSQLHFTNIAQPYIPIYTAAPPTLRNTHTFLYIFRKTNFQNFLGPFSGAPGTFAPHFRIPLLPLHNLQFFPKFLPLFHGLTPALPTFRLTLHLYGGTSQHTNTFLYFFQKSNFQKFLGPFPGPLGLLPLIFEFPYSRYISHIFSPTFDLHSHLLLHGTAKRLNSNLIRPSCTTPWDAQPVGPTHTWPTTLPNTLLEAVKPNVHRHPYTTTLLLL